MKFDFTPPPPTTGTPYTIGLVPAIIIFRKATGLSIREAKHYVERNCASEDRNVSVEKFGEMIAAWIEHTYAWKEGDI